MKHRNIVALMAFVPLVIASLFIRAFPQQPADNDILIKMKRGRCYGHCPVYSVTISGDGTVVYEGKSFVKVRGQWTYKIPKEKVNKLVREFERIDYFSLKDRYPIEEGYIETDRSSTTTSISMNGRAKEIYVYNWSRAPKPLSKLADKIDEIAGLAEFVGDE